MGYIAVAVILLIGFVIWKILKFAFRLLKDGISSVIDSFHASCYEKKTKVVFPEYSIDQSDFTRIAMKNAYRHPRIDDVNVFENSVSITIVSQTGLSKSHAKITFVLNGSGIGNYSIVRDNYDTTIPESIANKIQNEIRKHVGLAI